MYPRPELLAINKFTVVISSVQGSNSALRILQASAGIQKAAFFI
jgi:hypothetical protein